MTRSFPIYQIDAFTDEMFRGNPAAVVVLDEWLPNELMQKIAMENNLSETAFIVPRGDYYDITWFTPVCEVDLCGHATLSSAHVIFNHLGHKSDTIRFKTRQVGDLSVRKDGDILYLDFPSWPSNKSKAVPDFVLNALDGAKPVASYDGRRYLVLYEKSDDIRAMKADFSALMKADHSVIVTAPASPENGCDYVCRYFCAEIGIGEDPVTGSAQCVMIPYWAERLGKTKMVAKQLSPRGGTLYCELKGDRVQIGGKSLTFLEGRIFI